MPNWSLVRIPTRLATAWSMHRALTPPNPPAAKDSQLKPTRMESLFNRTIPIFPLFAKSILWSLTLGDITMVLLSNDLLPTVWKDNAVKYLAKYISWNVPDVGITPLFLLGSALCVLGCRFRSASYEALGRHFTFELAIRPDHELVTSYPYNIVRHPSYTGGFVGAVGLNLASFVARGGLVQEVIVPWAQTTSKGAIFIQVAGWGLFLLQTFVIGGLTARCSSEDVMLKKRFGKEWEEWAKRVPYKLLPGIY